MPGARDEENQSDNQAFFINMVSELGDGVGVSDRVNDCRSIVSVDLYNYWGFDGLLRVPFYD